MAPTPAHAGPASIGGYRLVRALGAGRRATVYLGHADGHPPVAVKVFAAAVPAERIEREAEALMRAAGEHVVRLDDLALDESGRPVFLLERVAGPSLGALLDRRGSIRPGEAVTVLAPLAAAVARMHRSGVVHGGLDPASVLFTDAGSPTLVGFGDAELLDLGATGRARVAERNRLLARDQAALRRVLLTVLERTELDVAEPHPARALRELPGGDAYAARLADAVFDLAAPEPVELDADARRPEVPGRLTAAAEPGGSESALLSGALQVPDWLVSRVGSRLGPALMRVRAAVGSVRRPFWLAGGAAGAALLAGLLLVPGAWTAGNASAEGSPEPGRTNRPVSADTAPPEAAVLLGDDPAAAARELLDRRAECFRELSVLCLDAVDQADSSASLADAAAILAAQEGDGIGAEGVVVDGEPEIVERLGDTALVRVSAPEAEPATFLLIRTEAGWRIRGFPGAVAGTTERG